MLDTIRLLTKAREANVLNGGDMLGGSDVLDDVHKGKHGEVEQGSLGGRGEMMEGRKAHF